MRRWLWLLAIGIRVVAAGVLVFGPWTDEPDELSGWDANRFQQIHAAPGRPWVDHEVEYPPGSVALIELLARDDVVQTQRLLVVVSLVVDLGVAGVLALGLPERAGSRHTSDAGLAYLMLGTAAVPAGLLRFDLWATACTAIGLVLLARPPSRRTITGFAVVASIGAAIKLAPALLIAAAVATRRRGEAVAAAAAGTALATAWLAWAGLDALTQVLSLRGATGWHVESLPGSLVALLSTQKPRFEADAYRIGSMNDGIVTAGRLVMLAVVATLVVMARRRTSADAAALVMLASTATLLLTAPLLSPQFLLWLTPPAALLWTSERRVPCMLTGAAVALTALTLVVFGPSGVHRPVAAIGLSVRDGLLAGVIISCALALRAAPLRDHVDWNTR